MFESFAKWPYFDEGDIDAVADVLRSGKINRWTGTKNAEFENVVSSAVGVKHTVAVANGSLALELALRALGVGAGDEVITSCRTFIASAGAAVMCGATPVVVDVDLNSQNISPEAVERAITPRTKAIVAVHHAGFPCDMDALLAIAKAHNLFVVEDCAQSHGAAYKGRPVGSIGDIGAWSYCQDKIITTGGEGGAATTNSEHLWRKMWAFKDHGRNYDACFNGTHEHGFRWLSETFGSNWRMTEMQAQLGIRGYAQLPQRVEKRAANAHIYNTLLSKFGCITLTTVPENITHSYYKYYCFVKPESLKSSWSRDRIAAEISSRGVPCFSGTCWNISAEKCFKERGWEKSPADLPNAFKLKDTALGLLVHPTITQADMAAAAEVIGGVLKEAQK